MKLNDNVKHFFLACIPAVIVLVILIAMAGGNAKVTQVTDVKNLLGSANDKITTLQTQLGNVTPLVNKAQSTADTANGKADAFTKTMDGYNSTISTLQKLITDQSATIAQITKDNTNLKSTIVDLSGKLTKDEATMVTMQDNDKQLQQLINTLQNGGYPTTPPTVPTTGTVTASLIANYYGSYGMTFSPITNSTATQTFAFQLSNNTGRTLSTAQLVIGLNSVNAYPNGTAIPYPANSSYQIAITSNGFTWVQYNTGRMDVIGYQNSNTSFYQYQSTVQYTVTVTVTGTTLVPINITPTVQLVNYTVQ